MKIALHRDYQSGNTPGWMHVIDDDGKATEMFTSIELPWRENKRMESCFKEGIYTVVKKVHATKYKKTNGIYFHILDVDGRDGIHIHYANYSRELLGCIAPGMRHVDIDGDGLMDVTESVRAMQRLIEIMPDEFTLEIRKRN
jgi:hypothetical protein